MGGKVDNMAQPNLLEPSLHPAIDNGVAKGFGSFNGGTLYCKCATDKVSVQIFGDVAHNHACGCSKCWKPAGALFSIVGVVPVDKLKVTAHPEKLHIVDESATIQRHACSGCGVHIYGRIEKAHPFKGLDFVHVELSDTKGWQAPQFAAFVSSIIEQGYPPEGMDAVRGKLKSLGLSAYDCLSPTLMDAIAGYTATHGGTAYKEAPASKPAAAPAPKPVAQSVKPQTAATTSPAVAPVAKQGGVAGFFARLFGG